MRPIAPAMMSLLLIMTVPGLGASEATGPDDADGVILVGVWTDQDQEDLQDILDAAVQAGFAADADAALPLIFELVNWQGDTTGMCSGIESSGYAPRQPLVYADPYVDVGLNPSLDFYVVTVGPPEFGPRGEAGEDAPLRLVYGYIYFRYNPGQPCVNE